MTHPDSGSLGAMYKSLLAKRMSMPDLSELTESQKNIFEKCYHDLLFFHHLCLLRNCFDSQYSDTSFTDEQYEKGCLLTAMMLNTECELLPIFHPLWFIQRNRENFSKTLNFVLDFENTIFSTWFVSTDIEELFEIDKDNIHLAALKNKHQELIDACYEALVADENEEEEREKKERKEENEKIVKEAFTGPEWKKETDENGNTVAVFSIEYV
jgi:hypothetical protein